MKPIDKFRKLIHMKKLNITLTTLFLRETGAAYEL